MSAGEIPLCAFSIPWEQFRMSDDHKLTNEVTPLANALAAAVRYCALGELANEDQRHVVRLALEISRLTGAHPDAEPAGGCIHCGKEHE